MEEKRNLLKKTYYYDLPTELIAQTPIEPRDHSRLLCYDCAKDKVCHKHFYDIVEMLRPGDVLVVNNTRVLPARLFGYKSTGAKIEILLQKRLDLKNWEVICKPAKRLDVGTEVVFNENIKCVVTEKGDYGALKVRFEFSPEKTFEEHISKKNSKTRSAIKPFMPKLMGQALRQLLACTSQHNFLKKSGQKELKFWKFC